MSLSPAKVAQAVSSGLSIVCATCSLYWRARDKGIPGSRCLGKACGGPLGGDVFPQYKGPLTADRFMGWCFVCGTTSDYGLRVEGRARLLGVCKEHLEFFVTHRSAAPKLLLRRVFVLSEGTEIPVNKLFNRPRKQTFWEFFLEVETYYANKEGREL